MAQTPPKAAPTVEVQAHPVGAADHFFADLFKESVGDFKRLPSAETAKWLGVGAIVAGVSRAVDRPVSAQLSNSEGLDAPFEAGATIGGARFQLAGAFAAYTFGQVTGHRKVAQVGGDLIQAQILSQALTASLKMAVRRTRPDGTMYSFPSGHASVTFASATVLHRHYGWKVGVPAYSVATYVAASRIQEKRHFLSDVAFGAAIGIVAGRTVTVGRGDARFALTPMATPGGGGVSFSWIGAH